MADIKTKTQTKPKLKGHKMHTVAANVDQLIGWNHSMAVALEKAKRGSQAEDAYFLEKLEKTANVLGLVLVDRELHPENIFSS
jgi:hypothetical protein